jgi:hypothetical protein
MTILQITDRSYASKTCQKILGLLLNNASFCHKMIVVVLLPYRTRVRAESKTRAIERSTKLTLSMFTVSVKS